MPKIQNVGVGNYIRNPRGNSTTTGGIHAREVLKVFSNDGNSFRCHPVTDPKSVPVTLDMKRYLMIPIDTDVEQVTI